MEDLWVYTGTTVCSSVGPSVIGWIDGIDENLPALTTQGD